MRPYLVVTLGYLVFGVTWILVSDQVVLMFSADVRALSWFQSIKGAAFVVLSAALICGLGRRAYRRDRELQAQREDVFRKTIDAAHHILLNYLNKMQIVTLEAENCADFSRDTLRTARRISDEASAELARLKEISDVTSEQIESVVYRDLRRR